MSTILILKYDRYEELSTGKCRECIHTVKLRALIPRKIINTASSARPSAAIRRRINIPLLNAGRLHSAHVSGRQGTARLTRFMVIRDVHLEDGLPSIWRHRRESWRGINCHLRSAIPSVVAPHNMEKTSLAQRWKQKRSRPQPLCCFSIPSPATPCRSVTCNHVYESAGTLGQHGSLSRGPMRPAGIESRRADGMQATTRRTRRLVDV